MKEFWQEFEQTLNKREREDAQYEVWAFGADENMARELLDLVKSGDKTATCSLFRMYEVEGESLPQEDDYNIITDWSGHPEIITRTTSVDIIPFNKVPEDFAYKEGEGDKSYEYWHREHVAFFTKEMTSINETFEDDQPVVCEEFEVVFQKD